MNKLSKLKRDLTFALMVIDFMPIHVQPIFASWLSIYS